MCPALAATCGSVVCAYWGGGPEISVNPSARFNTGSLTARVAVQFDVALRLPGAVVYASSVT